MPTYVLNLEALPTWVVPNTINCSDTILVPSRYGIRCAQVLVTKEDFRDQKTLANLRCLPKSTCTCVLGFADVPFSLESRNAMFLFGRPPTCLPHAMCARRYLKVKFHFLRFTTGVHVETCANRDTLSELLSMRIIPIINENDAISPPATENADLEGTASTFRLHVQSNPNP